jgi:signal transduction histidine kinase
VLVVLTAEEKTRFTGFLSDRLVEVVAVMAEGPARQTLAYARSLVPVIESAPVLVAVFTRVGREGPELAIASAACAIENLMLAAHAEGLGSSYLTGALYLADEIAYRLGLRGHRLVGLIPIGKPATGGGQRKHFPTVLWRGFGDEEEALPEDEQMVLTDAASAHSGEGEVVLVVTDTPEVDALVIEALSRAGYEVHAAGPNDALAAFEEHSSDVTIIDAILGRVSGYELARLMLDAQQGPYPIIIATPAYDAADEEQALAAGAMDVITKPVREHELLARVRSLANGRALYRQLEEHAAELQRANERLEELQRLRDDLTHMIVHDMRTPLTNVIAGLQTIEAAEFDEELTREFLPEAINAGLDLSDMISNLLDISKIEAGELVPKYESFGLQELVSEVLERVEHLAREGELELVADVGDVQLSADRGLIKRVLLNLLGNAIKFTTEGGSVTVEARETDEGMQVCVSDTGPGIPEDQLDRLFRKFSQLEGSRKTQGTGLGLAFVKLAIDAHEGRVWVESEVGVGSRFCFVIPN